MLNKKVKLVIYPCVAMVVIHIINIALGNQLSVFGIRPGELSTLPYIITAPWLHGSWLHLLSNLVGLAVFSALSLIKGTNFFVKASAIIICLTGLLVWLFARSGATHIGASGWIFGLWSLSIAVAWFQRSFLNIVIAVFVAVFYGGMIWGVLPSNPHVSFESHLFGAMAGVFAAYVLTRSTVTRKK